MSEYRDPLAAAVSHIEALERENEALERENEALKNVQSGRPAAVGGLDAVRLENELSRLDTEWTAETMGKRGFIAANLDELRRRKLLGSVLGLGLGLGLAESLLVFKRYGAPAGVAMVVAMIALLAGTRLLSRWRASRVARDRELHAKWREPLVRQIAALRAQPLPVEAAASSTVRVAELDEVETNAEDAIAPSVAAKRT